MWSRVIARARGALRRPASPHPNQPPKSTFLLTPLCKSLESMHLFAPNVHFSIQFLGCKKIK